MNRLSPKGRRKIPDVLMNFGRHLVYSEGTKSEPNYIESIKKAISKKYDCEPNDINIVCANGEKSYNTTGLIKFVESDVKKRLKNNERIDYVWIFFDKDDFPDDNFKNACNYENKKNNSSDVNEDGFKFNLDTNISYHCCYSNEAFELWLCLYFDYIDSSLDRDKYIEKLNEKSCYKNKGYSKNEHDIHQVLTSAGGSIEKAIKSAKKLCEKNKAANPSTKVYEFAEYFKSYMENEEM